MTRSYPIVLLIVFSIALISGCASTEKRKTTLDDVSPAAKATILHHTQQGDIEKICIKDEDKKTEYHVAFKTKGRDYELTLDEAGKVLEFEEILEMEELPMAVQTTVKKETKGAKITELAREMEDDGKTFYEVEFVINDEEHEIKMSSDGKILEKDDVPNKPNYSYVE